MRKVVYPEINPAFDPAELGDLDRVTYDPETGRWSIDGIETPMYLQGVLWVPDDATESQIVELYRHKKRTIEDALDQGVDDENS